MDKQQIFKVILGKAMDDINALEHTTLGCCAPINFTAAHVLQQYGVPTRITAGSFSYPYKEVDGVLHVIKNEWNESLATDVKSVMDTGVLPQIHIWLQEINTNEIIDFSLFRLPMQLKNMGHEWELDFPPDFIWGNEDKRASYIKIESACMYAQLIYDMYDKEF